MKLRLSSVVVGVATLATSAGLVLVGGVAANAATPPPWEPDSQAVGTITFYNSAGTVITTGNIDDAPFAAYAVGSAPVRAGDARAILQEAQPNPSAATSGYNADQLSSVTAFPPTTGPADITSQTNPVVTGSSGDLTLDDFIGEFPNSDPSGPGCAYAATPAGCTNTAYQNLYQLRLKTLDTGGNQTTQYDDADILVSGTTWTQVYPASKTATSTTLTAAPSPATVGQSVTLTATETPALAGSVQFEDGGTNIGSPVTVNGSGVATTSTSTLTQGSHNLSAVFTPTDTTDNSGSTGTTTEVVNPASTPTTTTLAVNAGDNTVGDDISMTATVKNGSTGVDAGSVSFFADGSTTALGTVAGSSNTTPGVYSLDLPTGGGLGQGSHSVVAQFTPTNPANFEGSSSAAQSFFLNNKLTAGDPCAGPNGSNTCTDTQYIQAEIPEGTLVLSTPYTASNPLDLGSLVLNSNATEYSGNAPFTGITVADTRSGDLPWTVSALATDLSDGGTNPGSTIDAQNLGLTNMSVTSASAGYTGVLTFTDAPAADPAVAPGAAGSLGLGGTAAHPIIHSSAGDGTAVVGGTLTLNAPTSTETGLFKGTITFTVG